MIGSKIDYIRRTQYGIIEKQQDVKELECGSKGRQRRKELRRKSRERNKR